MGRHHGKEGFETFSKLRPVLFQARFRSKLTIPPYGKVADRLLAFLMR